MMKPTADATDRAVLAALIEDPGATGIQISERTRLARNTVRTRLQRFEAERVLRSFEHRLSPAFLGFPLRAFVTTTVIQRELDAVARALELIPEVLEVNGVAGASDLIIGLVARDTDDLYRIAGAVLDIPGVVRTETGLVMRELIPYRAAQLLNESTAPPSPGGRASEASR